MEHDLATLRPLVEANPEEVSGRARYLLANRSDKPSWSKTSCEGPPTSKWQDAPALSVLMDSRGFCN
jgi:hypothetical protein